MTCPLCTTADAPLIATPVPGGPVDATAQLCATCAEQVSSATPDPAHFRALASTMWSEDPAIQVLAARTLAKIAEPWAHDLSEQLYLDDETRAWFENMGADNIPAQTDHRDSNGAPLATGDTVVLIKDLPVKGAGFTAKRGTAVHRISLVPDNAAHIEGRVDGQRIVILTEFVKKR
jgi:protein PhnA